jgi:hypothetical protein
MQVLNYMCFDDGYDAYAYSAGGATLFIKEDGQPVQFDHNFPGEAWHWRSVEGVTEELEHLMRSKVRYITSGVTVSGKVVDDPSYAREMFRVLFQPCLLALCFMHCKNSRMQDEIAPRAERRRAEREGTRPPTAFKTIQVAPIQRVLSNRKSTSTGNYEVKIRHGVWRDYRQGKGLFGKYHGLWWWEPILKLKEGEGRDYAVSPEKAPEASEGDDRKVG